MGFFDQTFAYFVNLDAFQSVLLVEKLFLDRFVIRKETLSRYDFQPGVEFA